MLFECEIIFKDEQTPFVGLIKDSHDIGDDDDNVFFYCQSEAEIQALMSEDNSEEFIVLNYQKAE